MSDELIAPAVLLHTDSLTMEVEWSGVIKEVKVKLSLYQAVEAHRFVRD
jgi:hypothetical protein